MMSNKPRSTLYIGVTNDYHCVVLVYCSHFRDIRDAVAWEKQLKGWRRSKKNALVERVTRTGETWRLIGFELIRRNSQVLRLRFALQNFAQDDKIK
jgi:predicted GIY-YIG superfamily endonuclease